MFSFTVFSVLVSNSLFIWCVCENPEFSTLSYIVFLSPALGAGLFISVDIIFLSISPADVSF